MQTVISKDGTKIAYDKVGSGPALVLVDGAFCFRASGVTPKLAPILAKDFTVYAYDRRGRGDSSDTQPYAVEREIEDLKAIYEAAGGSAYVLAFSSGGGLAMQAVASGLNPTKLALYEAPYVVVDNADPSKWQKAGEDIKKLVAEGRRSDAVKYFMVNIFGAPSFFVGLMKLMAKQAWTNNMSVAHTLPYDIAVMGDYSVPKDVAAKVTVPTLVFGGAKSPAKLQNAVKAVAEAIPGSTREMLPGQSHNVSMEVLAPVVTKFFKK